MRYDQQDDCHEEDESQDATQGDLELLDRLGDDGVDGLLPDVGGDAEARENAGGNQ